MENRTLNPREREWRHRLLLLTAGLLIVETLSGLSILFLPFSVSNQIMVLLHTGLGLVFMVPYLWYQIRHWKIYRTMQLTHIKLTGYVSMAAVAVAIVSGLVLTAEAMFGRRISYAWDTVHIVSTFVMIAATLPHVIAIVLRNARSPKTETISGVLRAQRRFGRIAGASTVALVVVGIAFQLGYQPIQFNNELPDDYSYVYGEDRPFAPSNAQTATGGAFDARSLGGSASCGRSGCHNEIFAEWQVSAHRYSALDPAFRAVQRTMGEQNGPESTRYCGGCHDPISLFAGTKNLFQDDLTNPVGLDEGVSCISCHAIKETDIEGNANYTMTQPERYMLELSESKAGQFVGDFLIRAYPSQHVESLQHKLFKSPEFCAACHKQFIDEEINNVGWVQLQNQYDNWRKSRWNHPGDPTKTIECRECHMPLTISTDPASGDALDYNRTESDGRHRSHRFLGANQFVPAHLELPGAEEHVRLTEKWLRGEIEIPEIADKWRDGPAVPVELIVPEQVEPGQDVAIRVVTTNNKVGHDFPTGPLDIIQAWVELTVRDDEGALVYESGKRDGDHFINPGSFIFKAEPVDQYGNLIDRHNLWEMVGVRFRRAMFPGFSDQAEFVFLCPGSAGSGEPRDSTEAFAFSAPSAQTDSLTIEARLLYRKVDQYLLNVLFGPDSGMTSPVTEISSAVRTVPVRLR